MASPHDYPGARRESPLHARSGAALEAPGVVVAERAFRPMLNVRADPASAAAREALYAATGLHWPGPNRFEAHDGQVLAWLGPDEFLLIDEREAVTAGAKSSREAGAALVMALTARVHALTPVGAGHTTLALTGAGARDLLARGCALDLHPRAFRAGDCVQTMFARTVVALLDRGEAAGEVARIDMIVRRSYADHVWRWLTASV